MSDWIEQLERLTQLHRSGTLTDEEFSVQKALILGQVRQGASNPAATQFEVESAAAFSKPTHWILAILTAIVLGLLLWAFAFSGAQSAKDEKARERASSATRANSSVPVTEATVEPTVQAEIAMSQSQPIVAPITYNPSFNCARRTNAVELMICRNRSLSEKDRVLSSMFKVILSEFPIESRQRLLAVQRRKLQVRSFCRDVYCLNSWYDESIEFYEPYFKNRDSY